MYHDLFVVQDYKDDIEIPVIAIAHQEFSYTHTLSLADLVDMPNTITDIFDFGENISNLLTQVDFSLGLLLYVPPSTYPLTLSASQDMNIVGEVDVPLTLIAKHAIYETNLTLPKLGNALINSIDTAWIKTQIWNTFPCRLSDSYIIALDDAGNRVDSVNFSPIVQTQGTDTATIGISKKVIQQLLRTKKGRVAIGMETIQTEGGYASFKDTDTMHIKMGMAIQANGKTLLQDDW